MAVSLPTAADVRKVREQAAKNVAEQAEVARTPLSPCSVPATAPSPR